MKTKHLPFVTALIAVSLLLSSYAVIKITTTTSMGHGSGAAQLRINMHRLWEDHVMWTRNVIFCIMDDLPGTDQAVARLQKNQDDIGNALKPIYGDAAGNKLATLLHEHISGAAVLLTAVKKGDKAAQDAATKKWFENADEISAFLSSANPNWKPEDMKKMMHDHLNLTIDEAVARLKKDYAGDVAAYDKVVEEILMMADMLTDGIIKQFPDKFKEDASGMKK